jgi:hypothetical protein
MRDGLDLNGTTDVPAGLAGRRGCMWAFAALVLVSVLSVMTLAADGAAAPDGPDDRGAIEVCHQKVIERLDAPATAEWPGGEAVTHTGSDYTVAGEVDSLNEFGVLVRTGWVCSASWLDGPRWKPVVASLVD